MTPTLWESHDTNIPFNLQDSQGYLQSVHPLVRRLGSLSMENKVRNFWMVMDSEMVSLMHRS